MAQNWSWETPLVAGTPSPVCSVAQTHLKGQLCYLSDEVLSTEDVWCISLHAPHRPQDPRFPFRYCLVPMLLDASVPFRSPQTLPRTHLGSLIVGDQVLALQKAHTAPPPPGLPQIAVLSILQTLRLLTLTCKPCGEQTPG